MTSPTRYGRWPRLLAATLLAGALALPACKKKDAPPTPPPVEVAPPGDGKPPRGGPAFAASETNLKQIGLAVHIYNDTNNAIPIGYIGPDGKTLGLSWRVALLPSLEQEALFKEFRLTEAWDSEHNKKLIPRMPKVYAPPQGKAEAGLTPYRAFVGKGTNMFWGPESTAGPAGRLRYTRFSALRERMDRTALAAEVSDLVVWTKPDELEVKEDGAVPKLDGLYAGGVNVLMWDGRPYFLPNDTPPATVKALIDMWGPVPPKLPTQPPNPTPTTGPEPAKQRLQLSALYRFRDVKAGEHVYSYGDGEPGAWRKIPSFKDETVIGYVATAPTPGTARLYRAYTKDGRHYFYLTRPAGAKDIERIEAFEVYVWTTPGDGRVPVHASYAHDDKDAYFTTDLAAARAGGPKRKLVEAMFYAYPGATGPATADPGGTPVAGDAEALTKQFIAETRALAVALEKKEPADKLRAAAQRLRAAMAKLDAVKPSKDEQERLMRKYEKELIGATLQLVAASGGNPEGAKSIEDVMKGPGGMNESAAEDKAIEFVEKKLGGRVATKSGRIPSKPLHRVDLGGTKVTDADLKELAALLAPLQEFFALNLSSTKVTDAGLKELAAIKNLTELGLRETPVTDAGLRELAALAKLASLDLRKTRVTDAGLKELAPHKSLTQLSLSGTKVTDAGLKALSPLTSLDLLELDGTAVTDAGLKNLAALKSLTILHLNNTKVAGAGLKDLAALAKLDYLDLSNTGVTDEGVKGLVGLTELTELHLGSTKVTDKGLKEVARLTKLRRLSLAGTGVTDAGLKELAPLKNLTYLFVNGTKVTDAGVTEARKFLKAGIMN